MADKEVLKEELLVKNALFKSLYNEHRAHEGRLQELSHKSLLSQSDELEEKRIKVLSLSSPGCIVYQLPSDINMESVAIESRNGDAILVDGSRQVMNLSERAHCGSF